MGNRSSRITADVFEKWNFLPPELKNECIKHMDFKSRYLLRSTSHTERALVDAQQFNLHSIRLDGLLPYPMNSIIPSGFDTYKLTICPSANSQETYIIPARNHIRFVETIIPLIKFILKKSTVEEFSVERIRRTNWITLLGVQLLPDVLNIKNFHGVILSNQETIYFVSKLSRSTQSIHLDANACRAFPFVSLIENETVMNSKLLLIRDLPCMDAVWQLAEKWIQNDAEIGSTFRVTSTNTHSISQFAAKFKDRIISENADEIRIKTDDPSKHILLKLAKRWKLSRPLTCIVISSETEETEFESFGRWVTKKMIPLWEYISIIFTEEIGDDDDLNFISFIMLLFHCIWLIGCMLFNQNILRR